jgi:predicted enzyme related to lactoylglutathione lyase
MAFLGLRTLIVPIAPANLQEAKVWYSKALGFGPYFDEPFYVGFEVGGYELGLHPTEGDLKPGVGTRTYWGVEDIHAVFAQLLELGATSHEEISDVGDGILVGSLLDPWGNVFGIIYNPHFKLP